MKRERFSAIVFVSITLLFFSWQNALALPVTINIDPLYTYLRTDAADPAPNAIPIELSGLGISPGDIIRLERLGLFKRGINFSDDFPEMIGVFSSSNSIASSGNLNRISDAIDAGNDFDTSNTFLGNLSTNISEDFFIDDVIIQVPISATYLFISAHDNLYTGSVGVPNDLNTDPNGDFAVRISLTSIPEPNPLNLAIKSHGFPSCEVKYAL